MRRRLGLFVALSVAFLSALAGCASTAPAVAAGAFTGNPAAYGS
jgi:hypothetical protein